jgi:hypothetical protein
MISQGNLAGWAFEDVLAASASEGRGIAPPINQEHDLLVIS